MSRLLVSVIIPVRDQAPRLRLTLAALRRQVGVDLRACEVIVVDDGSSDLPPSVLEELESHPFFALSFVPSDSRGCRGQPRNLGASRARGEVLVFIDADACPGEELLARHLAAQREERGLAFGDCFVVRATESLVDPAAGLLFPHLVTRLPGSSAALRVSEADWSSGVSAFFKAHAEKGIYPGQRSWYEQVEELLAAGNSPLAWAGVIPHNLSVAREDLLGVGGFDPFLTHSEGWDLGLRARRAGLPIRFAAGAESFHLFHWRPAAQDMNNYHAAQSILCRRYPDELPESLYVWLAATLGDPAVPAELDLHDWRAVQAALGDPSGRRLLARLCRTLRRAQRRVGLIEYLDGTALNSPMRGMSMAHVGHIDT